MSYAENSQQNEVEENQLVVLRPRLKLSMTLYSSPSIFISSEDFESFVSKVEVNGVEYSRVNSSPLSLNEGEFVMTSSGAIVLRLIGGGSVTGKIITAEFEVYVGTFSEYVNRVPTDSETDEVYVESRLISTPTPRSEMSDSLFGFVPVTTSSIEIANGDGFFDKTFYDVSWSKCDVFIYQCLGEFEPANWKQIATGLTDSVNMTDDTISISLVDPYLQLNQNFPGNYFGSWVGLDPNFVGRPIPFIYGVADGVRGVNLNYSEANNASINNRFAFMSPLLDFNKSAAPVDASYSETQAAGNTTVRTYVDSSSSIVGDRVRLIRGERHKTAFTFRNVTQTEYVTITAVGSNYIDHSSIGSPMPHGVTNIDANYNLGTYLVIPRVGCVDILMDGVRYQAWSGRDYNAYAPYIAADTFGIDFDPSYATNLSLPRFIGPTDLVVARVRGASMPENPVNVIEDLLGRAGVDAAKLDSVSFLAVKSTCTEGLGFSATSKSSDEFPPFLDLIRSVLATSLLRLYINTDGKWALQRLAPLTIAAASVDESIIIDKTISFEISYADIISDVIVEYRKPEVSNNPSDQEPKSLRVFATSDTAKYLHKVNRQKVFESLLYFESDAQNLADRLAIVFGDRQCRVSFVATINAGARSIGDTIEISRLRLPGFMSDEVTVRSRLVSVVEVEQRGSSLKISADEQNGIQENSGSW